MPNRATPLKSALGCARIAPMPAGDLHEPDEPLMDDATLRIGRLVVGPGELKWGFSRSSGPGGQNVNKVSSRAELRIDTLALGLAEHELRRLTTLAGRRLLATGELQLFSQQHRSQSDNKRVCIETLTELLQGALTAPKPRRATKPTGGSRRRRLDAKKRRGDVKRTRKSDEGGE